MYTDQKSSYFSYNVEQSFDFSEIANLPTEYYYY